MALISFGIVVVVELITGYVLYYRQGLDRSAVLQAVHEIRDGLYQAGATRSVNEFRERWGLMPDDAWEPFYSGTGGLLEEMQARYEAHFAEFVELALAIDSRVVLLYIPSITGEPAHSVARHFYASLAKKYRIEFVDLTEEFAAYPETATTMAPWDAHLSRFGHHLVAQALHRALSRHREHRSKHVFAERPEGLADLPPNFNATWEEHTDMPYKVVTNAYGFRMSYDFPLDGPRQKILVLGDSYTFGPYLPNRDLYTSMLDELMEDAIVMNAGMFGYMIADEVGLFRERARFAGPDVTVLQVLDNDLIGLVFFYRNRFNREKRHYPPTEAELEFLRNITRQE